MKRRNCTENEQPQLTKGLQDLIGLMEKKWTKEEQEMPSVKPSGIARVVKPAMSLEMYTRQIKIWQIGNADVPDSM